MITPPMGHPPSSYPFWASRTAMRINRASVSFLKNDSLATDGKLFVGRWAITFRTSSVMGVRPVKKDAGICVIAFRPGGGCQSACNLSKAAYHQPRLWLGEVTHDL